MLDYVIFLTKKGEKMFFKKKELIKYRVFTKDSLELEVFAYSMYIDVSGSRQDAYFYDINNKMSYFIANVSQVYNKNLQEEGNNIGKV